MTDIDPNEPFAGQLRLMLSMGMTDMTKNRLGESCCPANPSLTSPFLALARSGGRVQQAIDWIATDTIPETGLGHFIRAQRSELT
ncbi:hypothetical protein BC830DRAFT_419428 [Chytriomyces sp. MP71]|nr:hypothetical protein BC830DRAFT_419428 [Chytriomyces sp. MP71]